MKVTVDRREGEFLAVVLPDGECVNINSRLCPEAREGDVISIEVSGKDTEEAKTRIFNKLSKLKNLTSDK